MHRVIIFFVKTFSQIVSELRNVYKFRYVTYSFVQTSLKFRYRRSYLGFFWTVLAPMLHYIIMGLVFTMLMGNKRPDYFAYYFSGALFFALISGVLNRATIAFLVNEHFIKKIYVPKLTFVFNAVGIELVNFFLSGSSLIILGILTSYFKLSGYMFLAFIPVILAALALTGISCILSVATVYFRDFINITPVVIQAAFFATPVIYDETMIPQKYVWLIEWNPIYYYLKSFRLPLLSQTVPSWEVYVFIAAFSLFFLLAGVIVLMKYDNRIAFKL